MTFRTSWIKPMSSIRSASSRTKISTLDRSSRPWPARSSRRPGGGGENVHPPLELVHLGGLAHPAEDHRLGEGQVLAVGVEVLVNLNGQLPGGG